MYWSHFGLERQPFRAAVDPESYFPSASHEEAIAALAAGFARRDSVVLIDGPIGVGKSLVARKWLEHLLPDVPRVVLPNAYAERPSDLLQAILFDLGKPYQGLTEPELRLNATGLLLDTAATSSYPTVMVLDEAQHLGQKALEELRLLGNLETKQGSVIFTVLVAQSSLREALLRPVFDLFAQRIAVQAAVLPLSTEDSADYLRHQLRAAGGEPEKIIEEEAVSLLADAGGGIPRILNRAAALALELAASVQAEHVDAEAAIEALNRVGRAPAEHAGDMNDAVLLPHPARSAEPARSGRGKSAVDASEDEETAARGPKERTSRKKSV